MLSIRVVVPGGAGGAMILADQLTLSQPREADYAYQIILAPPDFQTFRKALRYLLGGVKRMILDFIGASILHLQNKIN